RGTFPSARVTKMDTSRPSNPNTGTSSRLPAAAASTPWPPSPVNSDVAKSSDPINLTDTTKTDASLSADLSKAAKSAGQAVSQQASDLMRDVGHELSE